MSHVGVDRQDGRQLQTAKASGDGTASRKADHIRINLEADVAGKGVGNGFDDYRFIHRALPDVDLAEIETSTSIFGRALAAPLLISCMTGGTDEARRINRNLARAAQEAGLALGLGSGRVLFEHPDLLDSFAVRKLAPDVALFANLGAVQLNRGYDADDCMRLVSQLDADALVLHLNALQEALQPGGDANFSGLLPKIAAVCSTLDVPVVVKEVGWGIAPDIVRALFDAGVSAVDVAGAGGTSWSEVERHRIDDPVRTRVAAAFGGWGIPTTAALIGARLAVPDGTIIASGGVRNGTDIAKALTLGADSVGMAGPLVRAAAAGDAALEETIAVILEELRLVMFCVGASHVGDLWSDARLTRTGGDAV